MNETNYGYFYYFYYYGVFYGISVTSFLSNISIIIVIISHKHLWNINNYLFVNLSASDTAMTIFYTIYNSSHIDIISIRNILGKINEL